MNPLLVAAILPLLQIPDGVTVKNVFMKGDRIARSIEVRRSIKLYGQPIRYYTSRTKSFLGSGVLADIESWSTMDDKPIKAIYSYANVKIIADFREGEVTFTKVTGAARTTSQFKLPVDRPVLLSQYDPLSLTKSLGLKSIDCAIVVPELQQVVSSTLVYEGPATIQQGGEVRKGTRFAFNGLDSRSWITLDEDGTFVSFKSDAGLEAKVDRWRPEDAQLFGFSP